MPSASRTHVFRPFSGYGTEQSLDYPFPSFIERAAHRDDPFEIWGSGDSARDWVHIDDIVGAVLAAIDNDVLGPVNICTGGRRRSTSSPWMCMRRAGYRGDITYIGDAPRGVHWRVGDPTQAARVLRAAHQPRRGHRPSTGGPPCSVM
jgi:nucleoside-diphosphate-sugar epimerase